MLRRLRNLFGNSGDGAPDRKAINGDGSDGEIPNDIVVTVDTEPLVSGRQQVHTHIHRQDSHTQSGRWNLSQISTVEVNSRRNLGTFSGVFAPIALSMFSTVLFLRLGFIVGQAGFLQAVVQFFLAYFILYMTILSICAVSTNGAVEGGGAYYMISRALGPEFGGSIGFLFFFANIIACALYVSGFVEALIANFGDIGGRGGNYASILPSDGHWWPYLYCTGVLFICLVVCLLGGSMFARTLFFTFVVIIVCTFSVVISFFIVKPKQVPFAPEDHFNHSSNPNHTGHYTGLRWETFINNMAAHYEKDYLTGLKYNFALVFAVLFSSVTGIMNGANMSGELKNPSKSIPRGTLGATTFTLIVYLLLAGFTAASCARDLLLNNYGFMQAINVWPPFIVIGTFCVTLSAALGNLIGASRVLEALGRDELFWNLLKPATITTPGGNPIVAVLISWGLVQAVLLIGSMNQIAPLASVFFLLSYAATNLACLGLEIASAPNFRPTFHFFTWYTCMFGLIGSMVMCFLVNPIYGSVAVTVCLILIILLHLRAFPANWGSISQALIFHQVRKYLLMLDVRKNSVKFWRPQMLYLVSNPRSCCQLIQFINDIKKGGLYVLGHVKIGRFEDSEEDPCFQETTAWQMLIENLKVKAFTELTLSDTLREGMHHLIRLSGLGGMKPNTIIMGFYDSSQQTDDLPNIQPRRRRRLVQFYSNSPSESPDHLSNFPSVRGPEDEKLLTRSEYIQMISDVLRMEKNICLCRNFNRLDRDYIFKQTSERMYIDVWPVNFFEPATANYIDKSCLYMLQLACILNMVPHWKSSSQVRVHLCVSSASENVTQREKKAQGILSQLRIPAEVKLLVWDDQLAVLRGRRNEAMDTAAAEGNVGMCDDYLHGMNELIRNNSRNTAVTFLYLPKPPPDLSSRDAYLHHLDLLTVDLPPTVLVHGLNTVTSTTL